MTPRARFPKTLSGAAIVALLLVVLAAIHDVRATPQDEAQETTAPPLAQADQGFP